MCDLDLVIFDNEPILCVMDTCSSQPISRSHISSILRHMLFMRERLVSVIMIGILCAFMYTMCTILIINE